MRVLAIDTALEACSVAVHHTGNPAADIHESAGMARGHAEALMPMLQRVLTRAGLKVGDVDRIAVTVGPGSFTGLRVGIAAARALALASGKPAIGLTTFATLAAPYIAADDSLPVVSAIDARHDNLYLQMFGTGGRTLVTPRVVTLKDAARIATSGSPRVVGTGAKLLAKVWPSSAAIPAAVEFRRAPDILWVARLGAAAEPSGVPPKPLYLQSPDAQPGAVSIQRQ